MPLYKSLKINLNTTVTLWKIEESFEDLISLLDLRPESLERVMGMKSDLHRRGFLSVRHLLRNSGYTDQDLFYDSNGKPHLADGKFISITHSYTFSAIIISDQAVGIDIEMQREKIAVISKKFIEYEFDYLDPLQDDFVRKLTVIWGVKESLYKLFATPGMLFKEHFMVIPFTLEDTETVAWIDYHNKKERFAASFFEFENFTCAYTLRS